MAGTSLTAVSMEQRKVFAEMTKPLQKKAMEAREIKVDFEHKSVLGRYDLGVIVLEVTKEGNVKLYGEDRYDMELLKAIAHICLEVDKPDDARFFLERIIAAKPWDQDAAEALRVIKSAVVQ